MKKKIGIALTVLVAVFLVVVAMQPNGFTVSRSAVMNAPVESVFEEVNDLRRWSAWSPWEKLDPQMAKTFDGPATGAGSTQSWSGNKDVGSGRMTIARSEAPGLIVLDLEFFEPMAGKGTTEFTFVPEEGGTRMTWTMRGENDFVGKAFCLVMDMDAMLGREFEDGLAALKRVVEAKPLPTAEPPPADTSTTADTAVLEQPAE